MSVSRREVLRVAGFLIASPYILKSGRSAAAAHAVNAIGGPLRIGKGQSPKISAYKNGNFVVAWREYLQSKHGYAGRFKVLNSSGAPLTAVKSTVEPDIDCLEPLIVDDSGQFFASYRTLGAFARIASQSINPQFTTVKWVTVGTPSPPSVFVQARMRSCRLAHGPALVLWDNDQEQAGSMAGALVRLDGSVASTFKLPGPTGTVDRELLALVPLANGGAAYAYSFTDYFFQTLFVQRISNSRQHVGSPLMIAKKNFGADIGRVNLSPRPDGGFVAVWYQYNADRSVKHVYWKTISAAGVAGPVSSSRNGAQPLDSVEAPVIARDADGKFVVASLSTQADSRRKIAVRLLGPNGAAMGGPTYIDAAFEPSEVRGIARLRAGLFAIAYDTGEPMAYVRLISVT